MYVRITSYNVCYTKLLRNQAWVYPTLLRTSFIEFPEPGYVRVEAENFTGKEKVDYRPTQDVDGEYRNNFV